MREIIFGLSAFHNVESKFHCNTLYPVMHGVFVLLLYLSHSEAVFSSRILQNFKIFNPARTSS